MATVPDDLRYTAEHAWARPEADGTVRVGLTDHAQAGLGAAVYVSLPAAGESTSAGSACGEVESADSGTALVAPLSGTVVEQNPGLETRPDLVNTDPYGEGWMVRLAPEDPAALDTLLDAHGYRAHTDS